MPDTTEHATPEDLDNLRTTLKQSNEDRRRDALVRKITRAHEWRVQVWAQSELRIREAIASLEVLGGEAPALMEADFADDDALKHLAEMQLSK
jgi:hypothetical protein